MDGTQDDPREVDGIEPQSNHVAALGCLRSRENIDVSGFGEVRA
jgi:hypothetical protein